MRTVTRLPIVYIDDLDGMWKRPRVPGEARFQAACDTGSADAYEHAQFHEVDEAISWGRARAEIVLVRLGPTEDEAYSAGSRQATRELAEFGGTDLTPFPQWPPSGGT
jgi:hypothetical protein